MGREDVVEQRDPEVVDDNPILARVVNCIGTGGGIGLTIVTLLLAFVVGMAGCIGPAIEVSRYRRMPVPDRRTLTVDDPGEWTIYHEYDGASAGDDDPPELRDVAVVAADGTPVDLRSVSNAKGETFGGRDFIAIYEFDAAEGKYIVSAEGEPAILAFGKDGNLKYMFFLLLPAFGLVMLAIAVARRTYLRRRSLKAG